MNRKGRGDLLGKIETGRNRKERGGAKQEEFGVFFGEEKRIAEGRTRKKKIRGSTHPDFFGFRYDSNLFCFSPVLNCFPLFLVIYGFL